MERQLAPQPIPGALLAIDQGTTNTKAFLVSADTGLVIAQGSAPTSIRFPSPGWVEQDANSLWQTTLAAVDDCLGKAEGAEVLGIGISNQRETVVCWSRSSGQPFGPALGWQDARTAGWCADLETRVPGANALVRERAGLALDPMFSAPKFRACIDAALDNGASREDIAVGTVDAWLLHRFTGRHATELGNASRTLLLGLETLDWDHELLELFGVAREHLPGLVPSDGALGKTSASHGRLRRGIPVLAVLADSHAALYYHGGSAEGVAKATYGTGSSVMTPLPSYRSAPEGIGTTVGWHIDGVVRYAREGNIVATGAALDWMATTLGAEAGIPGGAFLSDLAADVSDSGWVSFVPAFSGLGAPYWDRNAVGVLSGVSGGTSRGHLARAALEAVAHQVADVVETMEVDGSTVVETLHADGGATASGTLMQIQADLLARPVAVAHTAAASAMGVARLAAEKIGVAPPAPSPADIVRPRPGDHAAGRHQWKQAIARARGMSVSPVEPGSTGEEKERNNP